MEGQIASKKSDGALSAAVPAEAGKINAAAGIKYNAFFFKELTLPEMSSRTARGDPSLPVNDAMPGKIVFFRGRREKPGNLSGPPGTSSKSSYVAIGGNPSCRNFLKQTCCLQGELLHKRTHLELATGKPDVSFKGFNIKEPLFQAAPSSRYSDNRRFLPGNSALLLFPNGAMR